MLNPAWLFVAATAIAVIGILLAFKKFMRQVQAQINNGQELKLQGLQKEQTRFFINVAVAESIPILLIVFGFMQIEQVTEPINIFVPLLSIIVIVAIAKINALATRRDVIGHNPLSQSKNIVNTLFFIGLALMSAIPVISIVAIFIMNG
ncbi:hypothetical protein [Fredinandcohnia sp. 179-A 10B2 NHS]|uniref:hypothetical protein n=1 Tax=Fredinandcohnia sp. 179-A 10B2 NHS TaxID=3235176 RepID=UPI0039A3D7DA